jgi:hypothetical protein
MTVVTPVGQTTSCEPATPTSPPRYDLALYEGDSALWKFVLWTDAAQSVPYDLTGDTAKAEIRDKPDGTTVIELTCALTLPNQILVTLDATTSETVPAVGVWDLQLTASNGWVSTIVAGRVVVTPDVTE